MHWAMSMRSIMQFLRPLQAVRRFESLRQCQSAQPANKSDPEFYVILGQVFLSWLSQKTMNVSGLARFKWW